MEFEKLNEINLDKIFERINKELDDMAKTLNEQAKEIIRLAEESGVQSNFFFLTTFKRYQVQLNFLTELEKAIKESGGVLVTKEYVKGRQNLYTHPAVQDYNRTTDSANKTVNTLMKIIREFKVGDGEEETEDPLVKLINGGDRDNDDEGDDD